MFNEITLIGRPTKDPVLEETDDGRKVLVFRLAVDRAGKNNEADFFKVKVWEQFGEKIAGSLKKGWLILVKGPCSLRERNVDGNKYTNAEVTANTVRYLAKPRNEKEDS